MSRPAIQSSNAAISVDVEVVSGPDMSEFTARLCDVRQTIEAKRAEVRQFLFSSQIDVAYDLVEIGWIFLQGKAAIEHGMTGKQNASKNGHETVSHPSAGFLKWLWSAAPGIEARSAQNYMNAARNLGLSAESSLEDVRALRDADALEGKKLKDVYKAPGNDDGGNKPGSPKPAFNDAQKAQLFVKSVRMINKLSVDKTSLAVLPKTQLQAINRQLTAMSKAVDAALQS